MQMPANKFNNVMYTEPNCSNTFESYIKMQIAEKIDSSNFYIELSEKSVFDQLFSLY